MKSQEHKNFAFIDGQNLYLAIRDLGWKLDYKRFRVYLREKYGIDTAYMFMGFLPTNLLTRIVGKKISFVSDLRKKLEYKKKRTL